MHAGKNIRHELSEHAGMPVIEGEKWGFNLWFREQSRQKLYDYPAIESANEVNIIEKNTRKNRR